MLRFSRNLCLLASVCFVTSNASAAVLNVTDFSGIVGSEVPNPPSGSSLEINGANDATDQGWFIGGAFSSGTNTDLVGGNLRFGPAASVYRNSSSEFSASVGQISTDNSATTGEISFDFEVAAVDLDGGEEIGFAVQVLGWNSGTSTVGNTIGLQFNGQGSNWQVVGSAETALITQAGTFSTGTID
ncbi:MAG: hypothetical protein MI748_17170, partial [Opitutales bacterium]|nr:hypothetical protein [Opitutales bacterium]